MYSPRAEKPGPPDWFRAVIIAAQGRRLAPCVEPWIVIVSAPQTIGILYGDGGTPIFARSAGIQRPVTVRLPWPVNFRHFA